MINSYEERERLGAAFHAALVARDWTALAEILDDDVDWVLPGENLISGHVRGRAEVVARARLIASYGVSFELQHVAVSRDNMALFIRNRSRRGGIDLDEHLATVCMVRNGRVTSIETYLSDLSGMNAFFSAEPRE